MIPVYVSQRIDEVARYDERRDGLDLRWSRLLLACGIVPVIVPGHADMVPHLLSAVPARGVLLTGGSQTPERDATEALLVAYAIKNRLPLLGVCHGMQVIQRYFGVRLDEVSGHVTTGMEIEIAGRARTVNSYHDKGAKDSVPELEVWARAPDGVVKAIKHRTQRIAGFMWHPERTVPADADDMRFIREFFAP